MPPFSPALDAVDGVRKPARLSFGGGGTRGDSGRGREGRRTRGRGVARAAPTDLLKLTGPPRAGVIGVEIFEDRLVTYLLLFMGTNIPEPGIEVVKYFRPSTSPLFLPLCACSALSSTPANRPAFPATDPKYLIVPCMPPGTFTTSPTCTSSCAIGEKYGVI